jgi:hypothetical protein
VILMPMSFEQTKLKLMLSSVAGPVNYKLDE